MSPSAPRSSRRPVASPRAVRFLPDHRPGRLGRLRPAGCRLGLALLLLTVLVPVQAAVPVTTRALGELLSAQEYDAPARVIPENAPALSAELTARIALVAARVGDRVAAGDLLVGLDCRTHVARLAAARATLEDTAARITLASSQLARAQDLKTTSAVSTEVVDQRRTELDSLRAQRVAQQQAIMQAELDVERCEIRAPFVAVVTERHAQLGELASPGTVLLRLVALEHPELSADVREDHAASLEQAAAPRFRYQGRDYPVRLRTVLPVVQERQLTREARLDFAASAAPIGAAGRLIWRAGGQRLPAGYLVRRGATLGVFVLAEDGATARFVPLPEALEGRPAVVDLPPATRLIVDGRERLVDGDAVMDATAGPPDA